MKCAECGEPSTGIEDRTHLEPCGHDAAVILTDIRPQLVSDERLVGDEW